MLIERPVLFGEGSHSPTTCHETVTAPPQRAGLLSSQCANMRSQEKEMICSLLLLFRLHSTALHFQGVVPPQVFSSRLHVSSPTKLGSSSLPSSSSDGRLWARNASRLREPQKTEGLCVCQKPSSALSPCLLLEVEQPLNVPMTRLGTLAWSTH